MKEVRMYSQQKLQATQIFSKLFNWIGVFKMKTGEGSAHENNILPIPNPPSGASSLYRSYNEIISSAIRPSDEYTNNFIWRSGFLLILLVESVVHKVLYISFWSFAFGLISFCPDFNSMTTNVFLHIPISLNIRFWLVLQGMATATCLFHPTMWRLCIYSNFLQAPKRSKALWTAQNSFTFIQRVRSLMGAWTPTRRCWSVTMDQTTPQKSSPPDWTRAGESHSHKTLF